MDCGLARPFGRTLLALAAFRALLGLFVVVVYAPGSSGRLVACLAAFCVALASDVIDGRIARTRSTPNLAGYLQDSVSDKLFHVGCLIPLAHQFAFVPVLLWCLIARELLVLTVRILDDGVADTLKRFRPRSLAHVALIRIGIFGFLIVSFDLGRTAHAVMLSLSYVALTTGVISALVTLALVIRSVIKTDMERARLTPP